MCIKILKISPALLELANPRIHFYYIFEFLFGLLLAFEDNISVNPLVVEYVELE